MAESYTRQSTFADGDVVSADHGNAEFNQLVKAFHKVTGHNHDGTEQGGASISDLADRDRTQSLQIRNTGVMGTVIDDDVTLAADDSGKLATQKATKAYVDRVETEARVFATEQGTQAKSHTDDKFLEASDAITEASTTSTTYTDQQAAIVRTHVDNTDVLGRQYTDSKMAEANTYTDTKEGTTLAYSDAKLVEANAYTDTKDIATRAYVDQEVADVLIDEDNMASNLTTKAPTQQSTKAFVENSIADNRLNEPTLASNSATKSPSQQSVKAYVDAQIADVSISSVTQVNGIPRTGDDGLTGDFATTGQLVAGKGSGSVALTANDGHGNANVTFNHRAGVPDFVGTGNAGRIEVNSDSPSGASMFFELTSGVTNGVAVPLTPVLSLHETGGQYPTGKRQAFGSSGQGHMTFDGTDLITKTTVGKHNRYSATGSYEYVDDTLVGSWSTTGLILRNSKTLSLGDAQDFRAFHDGSDGYFDNFTGNVYRRNREAGGNSYTEVTNPNGVRQVVTREIPHNSGAYSVIHFNSKYAFRTTSGGVRTYSSVAGTGMYFDTNISSSGDCYLSLVGGGHNEHMYLTNTNNGADAYFRVSTNSGDVHTGVAITADDHSRVNLRYDNDTKLTTWGSGVNINDNIYLDSKLALQGSDSWLRINDTSDFGSGIYTGSSMIRTDDSLEVGSDGSIFKAADGTFTYKGNAIYHTGNVPTATATGAIANNAKGINAKLRTVDGAKLRGSSDDSTPALSIGQDVSTADAYMSFHATGGHAINFGLDRTNNKLSVGGWSLGNNSYAIYHEGNKPTASELNVVTERSLQNIGTQTIQGSLGNGCNITKINKWYGAAATYTFDESTFSSGDEVTIRKLWSTTSTITLVTDQGTIFLPDGTSGASHTMSGDKAMEVTLLKVDNTNWVTVIK